MPAQIQYHDSNTYAIYSGPGGKRAGYVEKTVGAPVNFIRGVTPAELTEIAEVVKNFQLPTGAVVTPAPESKPARSNKD